MKRLTILLFVSIVESIHQPTDNREIRVIPFYVATIRKEVQNEFDKSNLRECYVPNISFEDIAEKPTIVLAKYKSNSAYFLHTALEGINNLMKYPSTEPLVKYLFYSNNIKGIIYPKGYFPVNSFPDITTRVIPGYYNSLNEYYIVAFVSIENFKNLSFCNNYVNKLDTSLVLDGVKIGTSLISNNYAKIMYNRNQNSSYIV